MIMIIELNINKICWWNIFFLELTKTKEIRKTMIKINKEYKGLIETLEGEKLGKSCIMIPTTNTNIIEKLLKKYQVRAKIIEVYRDQNKQIIKQMNKQKIKEILLEKSKEQTTLF